jgi:hypothetical protein
MDPAWRTPTWAEIVSAFAAVGAWITSWYAASKVKEVHVLINSRLTSLLKLTEDSSFAAGQKKEIDKQAQFAAGVKDEANKHEDKKP